MRILYVGSGGAGTNSAYRAQALGRLGHDVRTINPGEWLGRSLTRSLSRRLHFHTGYLLLQHRLGKLLSEHLPCDREIDIAWVNGGELLGRAAVCLLRHFAHRVVLYNNDDPTGRRDGNRWLALRKALPEYAHCAVLREVNVEEYRRLGAQGIQRVWMSYDEVAHRPLESNESTAGYASEVAFIGTWMPERGPFMASLLKAGVPLSIWGDHWERAPEWSILRVAWRGPAIYGRDYVRAISGAKICLGMLSKGNRDLHTRRSVEVPFGGGLLCAERTSEHAMMYADGHEAIFWNGADECAQVCHRWLADESGREKIRQAGMRRIRELRLGNEDICGEILNAATHEGTPALQRPFHAPFDQPLAWEKS